MNNLHWVDRFFETHHHQIGKIFKAGGCRELWLQGQIFLYLEHEGLQTNAKKNKFDLYSSDRFACEIKVLGGYFQPKVKSSLYNDFNKLASKNLPEQKYVMLVLDKQEGTNTRLYESLISFEHNAGSRLIESEFERFSVIVWTVL